MKKIITVMALILTFTLAACGAGNGTAANDTQAKIQAVDNVVLVVSPTRRSYIGFQEYQKQLESVLSNDGMVKIVVADGVPEQDGHDVTFAGMDINDARKKKLIAQTMKDMEGYISQLRADDPELDVVELVNVGYRALGNESGSKMMIIDSNLLSSKGYLNLTTQSLYEVDIDKTVQSLKDGNHLPDLSGWKIMIYDMGAVNNKDIQPEDQAPLGNAEREVLKNLYTAFFSVGCNTNEAPYFHISNNTGDPLPDDLPYVTAVDISMPLSVVQVMEPEVVGLGMIDINEEVARFETDTANLISDRNIVKQMMETVAIYIGDHPEVKVKIVGTTATYGDEEECKKLSLDRAQVIADILLEYDGVTEDNLIVIGAGFSSVLQKNDRDANGLVEEIAKKNRRVVIIGEGNELYSQV